MTAEKASYGQAGSALLCGACATLLIDWQEDPDLESVPSRRARLGEQCGACHRFMVYLYEVPA